MKKITTIALSIIALTNVTSAVSAEKKAPEKQQSAVSEKNEQTKKQHTISTHTDKQATPQIGGETEEKQDRGLPKAFSGLEENQ